MTQPTVQILYALVALVLIAALPDILAIWRRWLGAEGTGPRSIKITCLAMVVFALFAAVTPVSRLWLSLNLAHVVGVCLWFVVAHPNGGGNGRAAVTRYGIAGLGYPIAYPMRANIPPIKILGWHLIQPHEWTGAGELWLGYVTGWTLRCLYLALYILKTLH